MTAIFERTKDLGCELKWSDLVRLFGTLDDDQSKGARRRRNERESFEAGRLRPMPYAQAATRDTTPRNRHERRAASSRSRGVAS